MGILHDGNSIHLNIHRKSYKRRTLMNPILKWPSGKHSLRKDILPLILTHEIYVEVFRGGLSILLNKLMAGTEIANDLDPDAINLYQQLINNYDQFRRALDQYNCNKDDFKLF
jgi:DNA adenine methylase